MLKKIKKNQENKFVINAILPLKTFLNFEKNTKVWSKIPYVTTERFSWKFQNSKIYPSVFALEKDCMFWEKKVEPGQNALNSGPSRCYTFLKVLVLNPIPALYHRMHRCSGFNRDQLNNPPN